MRIVLNCGVGSGATVMSAFDAALCQCGMYHNNLIHLSSMLPTGSVIEEGEFHSPESEYGERRYVVMARKDQTRAGLEAWAAVGWAQDGAGRGILVEITGESEDQVRYETQLTLDEMKARRARAFGDSHMKVVGVPCEGLPVCALVIAYFPQRGVWVPVA